MNKAESLTHLSPGHRPGLKGQGQGQAEGLREPRFVQAGDLMLHTVPKSDPIFNDQRFSAFGVFQATKCPIG